VSACIHWYERRRSVDIAVVPNKKSYLVAVPDLPNGEIH
jgi:hypothetical protein